MNNQVVSIIMPAFNAGLYIEESITSVINQTYQNWELIIINDGSSDNTADIAAWLASKDSRIYLINQQNKKLSGARNTGVRAAKGEWIAFLDADDLWVPEKLEKQLLYADKNPDCGLIFSDGFKFYDDLLENRVPYETISGSFTAAEMYKLQYHGNYIPVLSVIVKKKHFDAIGFLDEDPNLYGGCEDWDYWLQFAIHGVSFYGIDEKLFYYRRHLTNMSNNEELMRLAKAAVLIKNLKKDLLSKIELSKLNAFINITICSSIKLGNVEDAIFINNKMYKASLQKFRKVASVAISILGNKSYYVVRMIFKVNSMIAE